MDPIFPLSLQLDPHSTQTKVSQLCHQLRCAILDGRLVNGVRLPPTRQLADGLKVSRNTILAVFDALVAEGYLDCKVGSGTYVRDLALNKTLNKQRTSEQHDGRIVKRAKSGLAKEILPHQASCEFDFRIGIPELRHFPFPLWRKIASGAARALARGERVDVSPQGHPELRQAIANHVSFSRAVACHQDDILVTCGTQQALDLIARILIEPGKTKVAIESPGYPMAEALFLAAGAEVAHIDVDEQGMCVDQIPTDVSLIYTTPSHQFPYGMPLSAQRRTRLLAFAAQHQISIIEDDYDSEFRLVGQGIESLKTRDSKDNVFYVGTFSKTMFPDLRTGFVVMPVWAKHALIRARFLSGWHNPMHTQVSLADFIAKGHLRRHIKRFRRMYSGRAQALQSSLARHGKGHFHPIPVHAGVHATFLTPKGWDVEALCRRSVEQGVGIRAISHFCDRPVNRNGVIFGLGMIDEDRIEPAIKRLCRLL